MTEKEFFALALENELPDFEEIEKKCVCELRKKDNKRISTKVKVLSVAAVLLLLVGVSGIFMLSGRNADGVELPDVSVYSLWVTDDFGGCGYSDVNFFEYTDNGTIYNDFEKDIDLTDYVPPLFKNDYFDYIDAGEEENSEIIQADIIAELKKYLELIDFDFDDLVFVEDENPEDLSSEVLLDANTCVFKKSSYSYGYRLYVNIKNEVRLMVDKKSVSLHYYADYPVTQNARLCGNGTYGEFLLDDVYFCALAQYFGTDKLAYVDTGDREEDWLPLLRFYNVDAKNNQELLDSFYVLSLYASAAFYAEGFVSVSSDNFALAGDVETEIPFVGYENAYKAAVKVCEDEGFGDAQLAGCTILYYSSADSVYRVPCYDFRFCVEEKENGMDCFSVTVPCYSFSEYFSVG